jgi:hypothetical protein
MMQDRQDKQNILLVARSTGFGIDHKFLILNYEKYIFFYPVYPA